MTATLVDYQWLPVNDGDDRARALYLRHYSAPSHTPGSRMYGNSARFAGQGEPLILLRSGCDALFVWRKEQYRLDGQEGVNCSVFRNESPVISSELIREADDLAWRRWPGERLFTFVDPLKVRSSNPGYCFLAAGWRRLKERTKKRGLVILELLP